MKYEYSSLEQIVIDLDADPENLECNTIYSSWRIVEQNKGGQFKWDASKVQLFLHEKQQGGSIEGEKLRKELANMRVCNSNMEDYLLGNQHLIPEEWKGKVICFWGTIYRYSDGHLWVHCIYYENKVEYWRQDKCAIYGYFNANHVAIVVMD